MRWKKEQEPIKGESRVVVKFLIFPKCLDNEWRWFEKCYITQKAYPGYESGGTYWLDQHWLDTKNACHEIYKTILGENK